MPTPSVHGIDISHWNVVVDESAIPPYPLMSCKATEGSAFISPKFQDYWQMFDRIGCRYRGAFHWIRSDSSMRLQVDHLARVLDRVGGLRPGDFVQLDWERTYRADGSLVPDMTVAQIEEWVSLAEARFGDRVIVYGSDWVPNFLAWRKANPHAAVWYANYNTGTTSTGGWAESQKYEAAVWQWSSTYKVPGFLWNPDNPDDGIDVNHVWDWATLDWLCQLDTPPPPPPPSEEEVDMLQEVLVPKMAANPGWWPWLACFDSGVVRPLGPSKATPTLGQTDINDVGQYRRICAWAGIQLEVEMPKCADGDITVNVDAEGVPLEYTIQGVARPVL